MDLQDKWDKFIKETRDITSKLNSIQAKARIIQAGCILTNADFCNIGLIKDKEMHYYPPIEGTCNHNIYEGIIGCVVRTGRPRLVRDVTKDENYKKCNEDTRSELAVPIKYNEECIGVLNVESSEIDAFNKFDCDVLKALADFAASAINNAEQHEELERQHEDLERHHKELEILREIDQEITSSLDLMGTLNLIKDKASELINTKDIRIRLLEGSRLIPVVGVDDDQISAACWNVGECIVGKAAETKKPILENDVQNNLDFIKAFEDINDEKRRNDLLKINSEIAVPLLIKGNVIGVLNAHSPNQNAYTKDDCKLLKALADQASIAIENARLYNDLEKQIGIQEELNKIGTQTINLDLQKVLRSITRGLHEIIKVDIPMIYLLNERKDDYDVVYGDIRKDWESECHPRSNGAGSIAIKEGRIIVSNEDEAPYINPFPHQKGVKTTIAIPLLSGDPGQLYQANRKIAIMYLHFLGEKHHLDNEKIEDLKPTITKIIKIIDSKTITSRPNYDQLEKLRDSIAEDFKDREINEEISKIMNPDIILIYRFDEINDNFGNLYYSSLGMGWKDHANPRREAGSGSEAIRTKRPAIAYEDTKPDINPIPKMKGVKTTVAIPLTFKDEVLGVMYLHFLAKQRTFSERELKAVETFGTNAAIAIEKARSYNELRDLYELGRAITSKIKLDEVALCIGSAAKKMEPRGVANIFLYDDKSSSWNYLPIYKDMDPTQTILSNYSPRKKGIGSEVISIKRPVIIEDLKEDPRADPLAIDKGIKSTAAFPLEAENKVLGVLYFHFLGIEKHFSEDKILKLSMFSSYASIAINNALKFDKYLKKIVKDIDELRGTDKINDNLKIIRHGFNFDEFVANINLKATPGAAERR